MDSSLDTDPPPSTLEENWKVLLKRFETFHSQLDEFPHTFQLEHQDDLKADQLKKVRSSLQSALAVGYRTPLETARARNLLAYIFFRLECPTQALEETRLALDCEEEHQNVVSLANKAVMLWRQGQRIEAENLVQKLHRMKAEVSDFAYLVVKAKAELAFSYTRVDPSFYPLAQKGFIEVMADAREPEKWLWKFGLAFTRRRKLRPNIHLESTDFEEYRSVLLVFMEIVNNCNSDSLKAKVYAEIALLLYMPKSAVLKETLQTEASLTVLEACEKALEHDENENSVLWKCGKLYRYLRQLEKSCDLLKRAVSVRRTSKAYHHLGLTYKALATQEKLKQSATQQVDGKATANSSSDRISVENYRIFMSQLSRYSSGEAQGCAMDDLPSNQPLSQSSRSASSEAQGCAMDDLTSNQPLSQSSRSASSEAQGCAMDDLTSNQPLSQSSRSASSEAQGWAMDDLTSNQPESEVTPSATTVCSNEDHKKSTLSLESAERAEDRSTEETFEIWRIAKSPLKETTPFIRGDAYVNEAIDALSRAVELSEWENSKAAYDLALMYRRIGELDRAKEYLEKSLCKEHCLGVFDKINVFEQLGLVLKDIAEKHQCDQEKKRLLENSQSMLLMALKTASEGYAKSPEVRDHIGDIWHSFHTLLQAVDSTKHSLPVKLREKATLFRLIRNNTKSLALLQDIEKMHPEKGNDPEHLKLCIENYVEMQQYEEALTFVDLLQCTSQSKQAMQLFEDGRFLHKVYLKAAEQSLLRGSPHFQTHFRAVFNETGTQHQLVTSSEDTDSAEDGDVMKTDWDVLILHEELEEDTNLAAAVTTILRDACGLRVTSMYEDVLGGMLKLEGLLRVMKRSILVVVMAGRQKVSRQLRYFISYAAKRSSTVTLLVNGGHVPKMMKNHRWMDLPPKLLQVTTAEDTEEYAEQRVRAVCELFGFLVDIAFR